MNKYRLEKEDPIDILEVDNTAVRESQIDRLNELRAERDQAAVDEALDSDHRIGKDRRGQPAGTVG